MASKNPPSAIISGAGWLTQFASGVLRGLSARGWSDERIHSLVTDEGLGDMERGVGAFVEALAGPVIPKYYPETGIFVWRVDYDEPLSDKLAAEGPHTIGRAASCATDENFPDERKGKRAVIGRILRISPELEFVTRSQEEIEQEVARQGKVLARPKELVDFARAFPRPIFDEHIPLVGAGQSYETPGHRFFLFLSRHFSMRTVDFLSFTPSARWLYGFRFLVLDK